MFMALVVAVLNVTVFVVVLSSASGMERFVQPSKADDVNSIPYDIVTIPDVLTPEECDLLIAHGEQSTLQSSTVWDDNDEVSNHSLSTHRSSTQTWVAYNDPKVGAIVRKLRNKAAQLTGVYDTGSFEQVQLAKYGEGQEYRAHYDSCTSRCPKKQLCRVATLLVYLNDDFEGGATVFDKQGVSVRPRKGYAVLFYNVDIRDDAYPELDASLHAGTPVNGRQKWIANVWVACPKKGA